MGESFFGGVPIFVCVCARVSAHACEKRLNVLKNEQIIESRHKFFATNHVDCITRWLP
jgi:hypothetical protein